MKVLFQKTHETQETHEPHYSTSRNSFPTKLESNFPHQYVMNFFISTFPHTPMKTYLQQIVSFPIFPKTLNFFITSTLPIVHAVVTNTYWFGYASVCILYGSRYSLQSTYDVSSRRFLSYTLNCFYYVLQFLIRLYRAAQYNSF